MNAIVKGVIKNGLIMLAVGLALATIAPVLATGLGGAGLLTSSFANAVVAKATLSEIMWTGAFFGGFGALHAAIAPLAGKIFGEEAPATESAKRESAPGVSINIAPEQSKELAASIAKFAERIGSEAGISPRR